MGSPRVLSRFLPSRSEPTRRDENFRFGTLLSKVRRDIHVELREGLTVDDGLLDAFASRNGIARIALYGSALRDDFGPNSDIDLLVEFRAGRIPGLLRLAQMELELEAIIGWRVDLRTYEDLSRSFRDRVSASARTLYAA